MKRAMLPILCCCYVLISGLAFADEASDCQAAGGTHLTGTVTDGPSFTPGHLRKGVELSHTHVTLQSDQDGQSYDVAIDNVFASGYDAAGESVPAPLSSIAIGDHLDLCGKLYQGGAPGIDWVHTDCNNAPTQDQPDGWVKQLSPDGTPGTNLEDSQEYCSLWQ
jgi:hypothetical protein